MGKAPHVGKKVLVVEDEWLIASEIAAELKAEQFSTVGPAPTVERAMALVEGERLDVAVLDANIAGKSIAVVADALSAKGVPYIIVSGYTTDQLPQNVRAAPLIQKPAAAVDVIKALRALLDS